MPRGHVFRKFASFAAVGAAAAGVTVHFSAEASQPAPSAVTTVTGCAIRFTADGPQIHENSTHACTGAKSVQVLANGDLEITQTRYAPIVSMTVEEDETLSTRGILAGPSGGAGRTVVRFFATRSEVPVRADSPALQGELSNIWVTSVQAG
ncbi:hypothetical protein [Actinokineospora sp.]|uniref:hypothetical protein n=1 Tax=Actinokineospora sp. TaxID=1872133 RepID=UPI004037B5C4